MLQGNMLTQASVHHLKTKSSDLPSFIHFFQKLRQINSDSVQKQRQLPCVLTVSEMSALVTEGGLRWIRYGFINEHQAGMAAAISYHSVWICKAGGTRKSGKRREKKEKTTSEDGEIELMYYKNEEMVERGNFRSQSGIV